MGKCVDFVLNEINKETETLVHYLNDPSDPEGFAGNVIILMRENYQMLGHRLFIKFSANF